MSKKRRLRSLREKAWWISAQTLLHILTAIVMGAIFLFEDTAKDASSNSQEFHSTNTSSKPGRESDVKRQDILQVGKNSSAPSGKKGNESHEEKVAGMQVQGTALSPPRGKKNAGLSAPMTTNSSMQEQQGPLNMDEFLRHVEGKAMEDALKKRAAIESSKDRKREKKQMLSTNTNEQLGGGRNQSSLSGNIRDRSTGRYEGVTETAENAHLFKSENLTYLTFMLYRLIKTHKIVSVLDVPCTSSTLWMPALLQRLEFEVPRFHYRCIVPNDEYLIDAVLRYKDLSSVVILKDQTFWASILPPADLALTWYGLGYMPPKTAWQLLKTLRQSQAKYVIVPNHPDVRNNPNQATKHGRINVRRAPYLFDEPFRVVKNISSNNSSRKELLMYEVEKVRSGII